MIFFFSNVLWWLCVVCDFSLDSLQLHKDEIFREISIQIMLTYSLQEGHDLAWKSCIFCFHMELEERASKLKPKLDCVFKSTWLFVLLPAVIVSPWLLVLWSVQHYSLKEYHCTFLAFSPSSSAIKWILLLSMFWHSNQWSCLAFVGCRKNLWWNITVSLARLLL